MFRSSAITLSAIAIFVFFTFFIAVDTLTQILSGAVFVAAGVAVFRWGGAAVRVFLRGSKTEESWGILGLVLVLTAEAGRRVFSVVYLQLGRPVWMQVVPITPFLIYMTLAGIVLIVLATKLDGARPSQLPTFLLALLAFTGLMLSSVGTVIIGKLSALIGFTLARLF